MANYNADLRIGITGKTQLNALEAQFKRITKLQTQINKTNTLRIDSAPALKQIDKVAARLNKLDKTVTIRAREELSGSSSGGGSGGALAAGLAAGFRIQKDLNEANKQAQELKTALDGVSAAEEKISDNAARQAANREKLNELTKKQSILQGQVKRATNQGAKDLGEAQTRLKAVNKEINSINSSQRGLNGVLTRYNAELKKAEGTYDRIAQKQRRASSFGRFGKGAAASLAFSGCRVPRPSSRSVLALL